MSSAVMEVPVLSPTQTKMGVNEYLALRGGIDLVINFAGHCKTPGEAFDAARAYGDLLRRRLEESVEDEPMPIVAVKGSRVYLSTEEV